MPATRSRSVTLGGAIVAALVASSCCIGPLVLAALGLGGAGAFAALASYRPYILVATMALLAGGFYLTYRKRRDACGCEPPKTWLSWVVAVLVILLAAAPQVLAFRSGSAPMADAPNLARAVLSVKGVDCAACAAPIRKALGKVGGLNELVLDVKNQRVTVRYEQAPGRIEAYVAAIDALGYEASVAEER